MPERILIVHKGALGDFLHIWPSLFALSQCWSKASLAWAGRREYSHWVEPLGIRRAAPAELQAAEALYSAEGWPEGLKQSLVIWFGLQQPPTSKAFNRLWFLPGLVPECWDPPREVYAAALAAKGCHPAKDWPTAWRQLFPAPRRPRNRPADVLVAPGAGHPAKCWPLDRYESLAGRLASKGARIRFLLGPAEQERELEVKNFERILPGTLEELHRALQHSDLVIGNDSGPLHLAGLSGVPCLALFGPTAPRQWGPFGARILSIDLACAPCSRLGRIDCPDPQCLTGLDIHRVAAAAEEMLEALGPAGA